MESLRCTKGLAVAIFAVIAVSSARGILIAHDNFDYPTNSVIVPGGTLGVAENGFSNAWKFQDPGLSGEVVSGLEFTGVESSGNALKISNDDNGRWLFRGMENALTSGTYYLSLLFYRNDFNGGGSENWSLELKHSSSYSSGPSSSTKVSVGSTSGEQANILVAAGATGTGTRTYTLGSTVFMLAKITISDSGAETASMKWYNHGDSLPVDEASISWDATSTGEFTGGAGWKFNLPKYIQSMVIDEFKLGTEFSDVSPSGYDSWSSSYALAEGPDGDDDSDSLPNLYEYGLGGDPTNSADQGIAPEYNMAEEGGTNWFSYVHPVLSDPNHGLLYSLELNGNLVESAWTNGGYTVTGTNVTGDAFNYVSNRVSTAGEDQRFIRLVIEQK